MKIIPATLGYEAIVDDADYEMLAQHRWYAHNSSKRGTSSDKRPARRTDTAEGRKVLALVHHIIKPGPGLVVDHINGDPWDNRRANLRVCTHADNLKNRRTRKVRPGLMKGVQARGNRFCVIIMADGKKWNLGSYKTVEEAARIYDAAALAVHKEFACLNFPGAGTVARHPDEIRADWAAQFPARPSDEILNQLRAGVTAKRIAQAEGLSINTVCRMARGAGIALRRGRPRLAQAAASRPTPAQAHAA